MPALGLAFGLSFGAGKFVSAPPSDNTNLSSFVVAGIAVSDGETIQQPNGTSSVSVAAEPEDPEATVDISGDNGLSTGDNVVSVLVTAADGITTREYTITVHVLTAGALEITSIARGSFVDTDGSFFVISGRDARICFYFDYGVQPDASAYEPTIYFALTPGMDANASWANLITNVIGYAYFGQAQFSGDGTDPFVVTDLYLGPRADAVPGTMGIGITVTQQGASPV